MAPSRGHGPGHRAGIRGGWAGPALPSPAPGPGEARRSRGTGRREAAGLLPNPDPRLGQRVRAGRGSGLTPAGKSLETRPSPSLVLQLELQQKMPSMLSVSGPVRSAATRAHCTQYLPFNEVHFDTGQKVTVEVPENSLTPGQTSKSILVQHGVMMPSAHPILK